jgi:hypothetical protein
MKTRREELDSFLDRAAAAVRDDHPDPEQVRLAADRVWQHLAAVRAGNSNAEGATTPVSAAPGDSAANARRIRSHQDYLALIPAYLAGKLPPAIALLVEDYARESIPFRRALQEARGEQDTAHRTMAPRMGTLQRAMASRTVLAFAAVLLMALGVATFLTVSNRLAAGGPQLRVASADGQLFRVVDNRAIPLAPGDTVPGDAPIRTSKDGGAVVELNDGSRVELRERSEISVARRRGETTIRVDRGSIIVEAAKQHDGRLYVATDDCLVSVTGTIFSVNHGTKGSRVSVIEGEVRVDQGRNRTVLEPGEQVATSEALGRVPVADEISWSRDGERYRALLAQLRQLNDDFGKTLAATELRYESPLLELVPADTVLYLGLPNLSTEVGEMQAILEQRLAQSEVLRSWWQQQVAVSGNGAQIDDIIDRLRGLGEHLGSEVVVALPAAADGTLGSPLVLAQVERPAAFAAVLASEVERINAESGSEPLRILRDPASYTASADHDGEILLWLAGDIFAAAADVRELQALAATIAAGSQGAGSQPAGNAFAATPFHDRLRESYSQGAHWIAGFDAATVLRRSLGELGSGDDPRSRALRFSGITGIEHLIIERKQGESVVHTGAVLTFAGERQGALSWLAAPAPMGSLDFISADANFAASSVVESPEAVVDQILGFLDEISPGGRQVLRGFEQGYGFDLKRDLAASLGGEVAVAFDGPALPTPSWKVVVEVYDPQRLQETLELLAKRVGNTVVIDGKPIVSLKAETIGGRTYYSVPQVAERLGKMVAGLYFTYADGYLLMAPSRALLDRAIQVHDNGYGLTDSERFRRLLPEDGYVNFSAMAFSDLGSMGDALGRWAGALAQNAGVGADAMEGAQAAMVPTLACVYGEPDRIRIVSTSQGGALMPLLSSMLGMAGGGN